MEFAQSKWVDRYLLRYGPATVFGAFFLAYLYHNRRQFGLPIDLRLDRLELASIFVVGGFLFAYLASAPVLVFHFSRCLFLPRKRYWFIWCGSSVFTLLGALALFWWLTAMGVEGAVAVFGAIALVLWLLAVILAYASIIRRAEICSFYVSLARMRKNRDPGLVESYRTLREHGNAFYVIFWEIVLALVILAMLRVYAVAEVKDFAVLLLFVVLSWIAPAAMAWLVAGNLEVDLVESESGPDTKPPAS